MRDLSGTEPTLDSSSSPTARAGKRDEVSRLGGSLAEVAAAGTDAPHNAGAPGKAEAPIDPAVRGIATSASPAGLGAIAEYDLLRELGRGGMGVVYLARQRGLNRLVALKTILASSRDKSLERFRIEAEAAANLRHPGIVSVYDVGCENGCHFYSMEYVEGRNLSEVVRERSLSGPEAAEYVASVAEAMHYAHEHGILHRDLKPSNVLIDPEGRLKVADFGLAKRVDGDSELTGDAMLGTPSYMPPEQALPSRGVVGRHSDVYSLGAVLYFLLTCRPPFRADTPLETVRQMLAVEPVAPRLLNPQIPRDIETICLKCLEKDPKRRYGTAGELADELRRFLRGEPIVARPLNRLQRGWRWCRRHPSESALGAVVAIVLLLGVAGVTWQWQRAQRNLARATVAFERLNTASDQMLEVVEDWVVRLPLDSGDEQGTLRSTLELYEQYLLEEPTNQTARVKLAETHHRVGEIRRNLGQHDEAIRHFSAAMDIYGRAAASLDLQYFRRIAHERDWLGETQREAGRLDEAQANLDAAVNMQEALLPRMQDDALRGELARSLLNRALLWNDLGKTKQAMDDCRRAIELFAFESTRKPSLSSAHQQLARCRINLGMMLREAKEPGAALEQYVEAADLLRELAQSPPPRTRQRELRSELAQTQLNRGNLLLTARNDPALSGREPLVECERAFLEAAEILQGLVLEYPSVVTFQSQLANAYNGLGAKHQVAKETTAAAGMFNLARAQFDTLLKRSPENADFASRLAIAQANLASLAAADELPRRIEWLEQAAKNQSRAAELAPKSASYAGLLKRHRQALARAYAQQGRHAEAAEQAERIGASGGDDWKDSVLAAQLYVRALETARGAAALSDAERASCVENYAASACRWLERAVDGGLKSRAELENREQFGPLFERAAFRELQARLDP